MRAIDANVCVRLLVRDDEAQYQVVRALLDDPFLLLPTVLIEVFWVLRSKYELGRTERSVRVTTLLSHENAVIGDADSVAWAMARHDDGEDFADALHVALAATADATTFATFDKRIARIFGPPLEVEML